MRCARSPHRLPPRAANPNPNPNWRDPVVVGSRRRCCRCCRCCRCLLLRRRCCCSARRARFRSWPRRLSRCARQPSRPLQLLQLGGARHAIRRPLVVATALGSARPLPLRGLVHVDFKSNSKARQRLLGFNIVLPAKKRAVDPLCWALFCSREQNSLPPRPVARLLRCTVAACHPPQKTLLRMGQILELNLILTHAHVRGRPSTRNLGACMPSQLTTPLSRTYISCATFAIASRRR